MVGVSIPFVSQSVKLGNLHIVTSFFVEVSNPCRHLLFPGGNKNHCAGRVPTLGSMGQFTTFFKKLEKLLILSTAQSTYYYSTQLFSLLFAHVQRPYLVLLSLLNSHEFTGVKKPAQPYHAAQLPRRPSQLTSGLLTPQFPPKGKIDGDLRHFHGNVHGNQTCFARKSFIEMIYHLMPIPHNFTANHL